MASLDRLADKAKTLGPGLLAGALCLVWLAGCRGKARDERKPQSSPEQPRNAVIQEEGEVGRRLDLVELLPRCEVQHRGVLLDLGSPSVEGLEGWRLLPEGVANAVEREGATWLKVMSRSLTYRFSLDEPRQVFFSARVKSLNSKGAAVVLDGKNVGSLPLSRGQIKVASSPTLSNPVAAGMHTLTLRFSGASREGIEPVAEVDWLRVGFPDDDSSAFAAPTQSDVLQPQVALGGVPRRAIALRAPASVRCMLGVPTGARLRTSVAVLGSGEGEAEVRATVDGQPGEVLRTVRVLGGEKPLWTDLDLQLEAQGGKQIGLELVASNTQRGSRIVFGDPRLVSPGPVGASVPRAKAVIVVVVSSVDPAKLPPWAPDRPLPTFDALAREGAIFERYRVPSTVVGAVMGSLLTGLSPRQHGVEDSYARLPEGSPTLSTVARDASVHTAMFTTHPASFAPFGFARGWDKFTAYPPMTPAFGTKPIDDLIAWISDRGARADKGLLAVVHTRGIHPPYDVSPGEFAQMPPHPEREYAGPLDPRRAGQVLERFRTKKRGNQQKWSDADALRLKSLIDTALIQTDRSLSNLIDALRKAGLWNDTLLMVTSDVSAAADPNVLPFADFLEPSEEALRVPLYVHFPGGAHAGERLQAPVTTVDLAFTALRALGLAAAAAPGGEDLFSLAEQGTSPVERPLVATLGDRVVVRWGSYRLVARDGHAPLVCELESDPKCERDLTEKTPLLTRALWRFAYEHEAQSRPPRYARPRREPATMDPDIAAAMSVWGR